MSRIKTWGILAAILAFTFVIRCIHLLVPGHYYLVNQDGFYFHWLVRHMLAGMHVNIFRSGLAYPLVLLAKLTGLKFASIICAPCIAVLIGLGIFLFARMLYSDRVALCSAFCWAIAMPAIFYGLAGNLDRDILCIGLVALGMFLLYMFSPLGLLACLALLYVFWGWLGVAVLLGLSAAWSAVWLLLQRTRGARIALALLTVVSLLGIAFGIRVGYLNTADQVWKQNIQEAEHSPLGFIGQMLVLGLPLAFGLILAWKYRNQPPQGVRGLYLLVWAGCGIAAGFIASRLTAFAIVPCCMLAGLGLNWILRSKWKALQLATGAMLAAGVVLAFFVPPNSSMPNEWVSACEWVRDNTAENVTVMSQWDNGYWILDVADRHPFIHNGYNPPDLTLLVDQIYCSENEEWAAGQVKEAGCQLLVMSCREKHYWKNVIAPKAKFIGDKLKTLYWRAIDNRLDGKYFETVYRNETVVILEPR